MEDYNTFPAPFGSDILEKIEAAAVAAARELLTGRRILEVEGPYGLGLTTVEVGNDELCRQPGPDEASAVMSRAVSVPMIYRRFALSKRRIAAVADMHQPHESESGRRRRAGGGATGGGVCVSGAA